MQGYTVFSIPVGTVFRPHQAKIKNIGTRDFLGKARLVAASSSNDGWTPFGRKITVNSWHKDDRLPGALSYAATKLVKPDLSLRVRQRSEPPLDRHRFPPTPPPESEKPLPARPSLARSESENVPERSRSTSCRPDRLQLGSSAFRLFSPPQKHKQNRTPVERPSAETPSSVAAEPDAHEAAEEKDATSSLKETRSASPPGLLSRRLFRLSGVSSTHFSQRRGSIREEDDDGTMSTRSYSTASTLSGLQTYSDGRTISSRSLPMVHRIRLKLHHGDETRYIVVPTTTTLTELMQQVTQKVEAKRRIRLRTRDEDNDLITIGDQEDLDVLISACKHLAETQAVETGKMEIWVDNVK